MCVHVCVFSPITQGRGKSFHFLDESLVNQKPRDLLLTLCTASLFLSHLPLSFYRHLFYPSNPQTFAIKLPLYLSLTFISLPPLFQFLLRLPPPMLSFASTSNHPSISALHPFIFLTFSPSSPTPNHPSLLLQSQHFRSAVLCRHTSALIYTFIPLPNQFYSISIADTFAIIENASNTQISSQTHSTVYTCICHTYEVTGSLCMHMEAEK